jgi:hypothetical protein
MVNIMENLYILFALFSADVAPLPTDCSNQGVNRPLIHHTNAGVTWSAPNTVHWCNPDEETDGINPQEDPTFAPKN